MRDVFRGIVSTVMAVFILAVTTGCSAFRPHSQTINVSCSPEDAVLMINGQRHTPPVQVEVQRNRDLCIQAHKKGYMPYQRTVGHHLNKTGALDAVGTLLYLVPCVGLLTPGAWSLDATNVGVALYQE